MGCRSDYLEPNGRERALQEAAQFLLFVRRAVPAAGPVTDLLVRASKDIYCRDDYVPELCTAIKGLSEEDLDRIVYNARDPVSRKLADWWETHQAADRAREAREATDLHQAALRESALAKLTPEEKAALKLT